MNKINFKNGRNEVISATVEELFTVNGNPVASSYRRALFGGCYLAKEFTTAEKLLEKTREAEADAERSLSNLRELKAELVILSTKERLEELKNNISKLSDAEKETYRSYFS